MKLCEKIRLMRKEKGIKLKDLHRKILDLFGENSLTYTSLFRIERGSTKARESSLFQISTALGISPQNLKEGTERQEPKIRDLIKKKDIIGKYIYNKNAYLEMLSGSDLNFLPAKLVLLPATKTPIEQDPKEKGQFLKWIYGLQGEIILYLVSDEGIKEYTIHKMDKVYFESIYPHYFENKTSKKASCLIVQNPRYI